MSVRVQGTPDEVASGVERLALGTNDRACRVADAVKGAIVAVAKEMGGYLSVSVTGDLLHYEGGVGEGVNIQFNSVLSPPAPVKDAGLDAAAGSARNFPPEASTAAPAPESQSAPAAQPPIPQPAENVVVVTPEDVQEVPAEEVATDASAVTTLATTEPAPVAAEAVHPAVTLTTVQDVAAATYVPETHEHQDVPLVPEIASVLAGEVVPPVQQSAPVVPLPSPAPEAAQEPGTEPPAPAAA